MSTIRVLLADDHTVLRSGLKLLLNAQHDIEVIGEARDGKEAVEKACELKPDIVLMDITMPLIGGLDATKEIRQMLPDTNVLILTMHDDPGYLRQLLEAGARGYLLKKAADTELVNAIRAVYQGDMFVDSSLTQILVNDHLIRSSVAQPPVEKKETLSDRESEVLKLIALGHTNQEVACRLRIGVKTVETYKARLMEKLKLRGRAELVRYAISRGWLR